jgi:hypothetical protein
VIRVDARALVSALDELVSALAAATPGGDVSWIRPLAVLRTEVEYSALHGAASEVDEIGEECTEIVDLLSTHAHPDEDFSSRYSIARLASPSLDAAHERAVEVCLHFLSVR